MLFRFVFSPNIRESLNLSYSKALIFYNGKWDDKFHNHPHLLKFVLKYRDIKIMGHCVMRAKWSARSAGRRVSSENACPL